MRDVVWLQSLRGKAIDMVHPRADQVDFREIAEALSTINRYAGAAEKPVSVALHTLIACDAAPESARPFVLLHDAHETRIGDIPTPAADAMSELAAEMLGPGYRAQFAFLLNELKRRHDDAIFEAAGLSLADGDKFKAAIRQADLVAMVTERRDFMARPPRPWNVDAMGIVPLRKVYRLRPAADVADDLYARFQQYLPALATVRRREIAMA